MRDPKEPKGGYEGTGNCPATGIGNTGIGL